MTVAGSTLISADEGRALVAPFLSRHLKGRDLDIALDNELMFADEYDRSGVLTLPDGAVIDGDLLLDYDDEASFRGIVALGALTVTGDIVNENCDGGPFLVVLGPLQVRHILKGGTTVIAGGPVTASGTIYCSYNHGSFRAWGGLTADALIVDDQRYEITGPADVTKLVLGEDDVARYLVPDLLWEEDDGSVVPMDDLEDEITSRIRAGEPIFRADAPRLRR